MSLSQNGLTFFSNGRQTLPSFFSNSGSNAPILNWNAYNGVQPYTRILAYLLAIIIVVFVLLLFVHFFIRPIFRLHPGSPGIIPVPGWDDGTLFWNKGNSGVLSNSDLPIADKVFDYSMMMDIFVENPFQFSKNHRIIFSRGGTRVEQATGDTLLGSITGYNVVVALLPDTTDMVVSVLNAKNNMENVVIPNVPIQEPFRLGMIVMNNALEVYINGHLVKTRTFLEVPLDVKGNIEQTMGIEANVAKIRNLKIWPRIVTTSEIRDARPPLSTPSDFAAGPIPASSSCPSASASASASDPNSACRAKDSNRTR